MNNFGAQSADYSSFQFSVFSFQIAEIRGKIVRAAPRAARVNRTAIDR